MERAFSSGILQIIKEQAMVVSLFLNCSIGVTGIYEYKDLHILCPDSFRIILCTRLLPTQS